MGTVIADRYRIVRALGHGGMGAVYLAEHVRMDKPFALKILHPEMTYINEAVFRFEQEAVATGRVDHEHLVSATDFGELPDGALYLVLEFVDGRSLSDLCADGPIGAERALDIGHQIAEALEAVHEAGIVHRDLKPDNVMVAERDGRDFIKVLDFGMAKVQVDRGGAGTATNQGGAVLGTPRFMSPEQAAGLSVDARSDLYALGLLLYTMLSGDYPFVADDASDVLRMHREDPPAPLPESVDAEVSGLVMRLLAKAPQDRFQSAKEVRELLGVHLQRLRGSGRRPSGQPSRWLLPVASLAVLLALVALAVVLIDPMGDDEASGRAPVAAPVDVNLERVIAKAEVGDEAAWRALEQRPDDARSAREWFALGAGRAAGGQRARAMDAYQRALEMKPGLSTNRRLLSDVAIATDDRAAWKSALRLAALLPGPEGPDILFDVWASTPRVTDKTTLARRLLESDRVAKRRTEALQIALALREAETCEARRALLGAAIEHGDARSRLPLFKMRPRGNCDPTDERSCNACLEGDGRLQTALERVAERPAPSYVIR